MHVKMNNLQLMIQRTQKRDRWETEWFPTTKVKRSAGLPVAQRVPLGGRGKPTLTMCHPRMMGQARCAGVYVQIERNICHLLK